MGMCVAADPPDAAFVGLDASFELIDGGGLAFPDAALGLDAGAGGEPDSGRRRGGGSSGCSCRAPGGRTPPNGLAMAGLVTLGMVLVRRRRRSRIA
jgi:MYXO-CTERM domain-containing protein